MTQENADAIRHQFDWASMWSGINVIADGISPKSRPRACILEGYKIWHVWRSMVDEIARNSVIMKTKLYNCDWLLNPHSALPHIPLINALWVHWEPVTIFNIISDCTALTHIFLSLQLYFAIFHNIFTALGLYMYIKCVLFQLFLTQSALPGLASPYNFAYHLPQSKYTRYLANQVECINFA